MNKQKKQKTKKTKQKQAIICVARTSDSGL